MSIRQASSRVRPEEERVFAAVGLVPVVLGGVSLTGGRGRIQDVLIASVFLGTIANGLILLGVSGYTQQVVSGAILVGALALDRWRRTT